MEKNEFHGVTLRAAIDAGSVNVEERSFDVVIASESPIRFRDYKYKDSYEGAPEVYDEILLCNETALRSERLKIGVPLFPSHWERSVRDQLGISTTFAISDRACKAKIKLGARADDVLWSDIQNGITKAVSVGAKIYKVERTTDGGMLTYKATDWEPMHIALAPEPADTQATVLRSADMVIVEPQKEEKKPSLGITFNSLINKF